MKSSDIITATTIDNKPYTEPDAAQINVGLSACLAGQEVRYNGGHTQSRLCLKLLRKYFTFKTFCPEVAAGFGIPRPTMRLIGDPNKPTLTFSNDESSDLTAQLERGYTDKLSEFSDLDGYILMKNSPSCGLERVKVYQANGHPHQIRVQGLFAAALQQRYPLLPIEEEGRLHDPQLFENFVLRVYAYRSFKSEVVATPLMRNLLAFHSQYKYILMAHNQTAYKELGRMLGQANKNISEDFVGEYFELFMRALENPANRKNHTNTLMHMLGYLRKKIPSAARQGIAAVIHKYHKGQLPLITPLTLLNHYIEQYGSDYIRSQRYLKPYPESLGLANRL
ncbi:YbgA family protein [Dasania marina]|uniref:YbgA family protein n=1 Tax=Dasania marina TaxID=471499 RepID=UPI0004AC7873|nr:DUF523 and DUF1722 domain-containing protein [Dasania marina]